MTKYLEYRSRLLPATRAFSMLKTPSSAFKLSRHYAKQSLRHLSTQYHIRFVNVTSLVGAYTILQLLQTFLFIDIFSRRRCLSPTSWTTRGRASPPPPRCGCSCPGRRVCCPGPGRTSPSTTNKETLSYVSSLIRTCGSHPLRDPQTRRPRCNNAH